jgi:hypothetical protein
MKVKGVVTFYTFFHVCKSVNLHNSQCCCVPVCQWSFHYDTHKAGVAQLVTTLQTSQPVRVRIPAIPKRPWLRGRGPSPRVPWFQWKICRGPLDEQKIPRGCTRAVQPGTPFPNLYRCNKVLVYKKTMTHTACSMAM